MRVGVWCRVLHDPARGPWHDEHVKRRRCRCVGLLTEPLAGGSCPLAMRHEPLPNALLVATLCCCCCFVAVLLSPLLHALHTHHTLTGPNGAPQAAAQAAAVGSRTAALQQSVVGAAQSVAEGQQHGHRPPTQRTHSVCVWLQGGWFGCLYEGALRAAQVVVVGVWKAIYVMIWCGNIYQGSKLSPSQPLRAPGPMFLGKPALCGRPHHLLTPTPRAHHITPHAPPDPGVVVHLSRGQAHCWCSTAPSPCATSSMPQPWWGEAAC